jgi:hypothetical protein
VNIGISSCGATIPASLACGVPCLDLGGGLVLNLAQQSYYAMGPFAGIAFFSATNPAMTVAPAWAFSLNGSGAEALIYSNNNFDSIQATAFSTTSTLWTFGIGVQFDVNPIVATSGAGAAITINGPSGYSAQNLLQVNGSTLGAMYVDASQTIMGSVTANPLKLIYNNSAVLTMTNISMNVPGLPTSAGSGGLYICVDTSGNFYKKSSCP